MTSTSKYVFTARVSVSSLKVKSQLRKLRRQRRRRNSQDDEPTPMEIVYGHRIKMYKPDRGKPSLIDPITKRREEHRNKLLNESRFGSKKPLKNLSEIIVGIQSKDTHTKIASTIQLRKHIFRDPASAVDVVIKNSLIPKLVGFLGMDGHSTIQMETAWIMNMITRSSPEHTDQAIRHGAVPALVNLIASPSEEVSEQALATISNIASTSVSKRDMIISLGAVTSLMSRFDNHSKLSLLREMASTLLSLVDRKPSPVFAKIKVALPALAILIQSEDPIVMTAAFHALYLLSDIKSDDLQCMFEAGVTDALVKIVNSSNGLPYQGLLTLCNMLRNGSTLQTRLLGNDCFEAICKLLHSQDVSIVIACLSALEEIFKAGPRFENNSFLEDSEGVNCYARRLHSQDDKMEFLRMLKLHSNSVIKEKATLILENFWNA